MEEDTIYYIQITTDYNNEADPFERGQDREIEGDITSRFIESEGKKNRRVVILDLASDIAQQILASQNVL